MTIVTQSQGYDTFIKAKIFLIVFKKLFVRNAHATKLFRHKN